MKYVKVKTATIDGLKIIPLELEVTILKGLPRFEISGIQSARGQEMFSRVRAALLNNGFKIPNSRIVCNLSCEVRYQEQTAPDLALALAILLADRQISSVEKEYFVLGRLSLSGQVSPIRGLYAIWHRVEREDKNSWLIPRPSQGELCYEKITRKDKVFSIGDINQAVDVVSGKNLDFYYYQESTQNKQKKKPKKVLPLVAQPLAQRALTIALAGRHPLLLIGSPGCGKTSLAESAADFLPDLDPEERREIRELYSLKGMWEQHDLDETSASFQAPPYQISQEAMLGGGRDLLPGLISLAHQGILFLDEFNQFRPSVIQLLRKPMSEQKVELNYRGRSLSYPANFLLIAAMNPCPCGYLFEGPDRCHCKEYEIKRYKKKISASVLDRFQLAVVMKNLHKEDLIKTANVDGLTDSQIKETKEMIVKARAIQKSRCMAAGIPNKANSQIQEGRLLEFFQVDRKALSEYNNWLDAYKLSPRSYLATIKVSRTIADLAQSPNVRLCHLQEALMFRIRDEIY